MTALPSDGPLSHGRFLRSVLRRLLPPDRFEAVEGDLAELFSARRDQLGSRQARARYRHDVASLVLHALLARPSAAHSRDRRPHMRPTLQELRSSLRGLARQPGFVLTAALTLALGIGATTTVLTVVQALVVRPALAIGRDIVIVWGTNRTVGQPRDVVSGPTFLDLQRENHSLAGLAAFHFGDLTVREGTGASVISTLEVTPEFFDVIGARPWLGRVFEPADARGDAQVILLSHAFWQRRFGGDPQVVGRSLAGKDTLRVVVGVLPPDFRFPAVPDVVTLLQPRLLATEARTYYNYWLVGRLRPGTTIAGAEQDLDAVMSRVATTFPPVRGWDVTVEGLATVMGEPVRPAALLALATATLVLLIACANVASLVLTRGVERRRELAIRMSLGATRSRIFAAGLLDAALLAAVAGAIGLGLSVLGARGLTLLLPPDLALGDSAATIAVPPLSIDRTAFVFAAVVAAATVLLCGLAPAWRASRQEAQSSLMPTTRGATPSRADHRFRGALVTLETGLATVLLVLALLLGQTLARLRSIDPGFRGDGVVAMTIGRVDDLGPDARQRYYTRVLEQVAAEPGVAASALNDYVLLTNEDDYEGFEIEGRPRLASGGWPREEWRRVSADYFRALGIPIVGGRGLTVHDTAESPSVVVINETMAKKYWPGEDPLGRRLRLTARAYGWSSVVGIVGDVREVGLDRPAKPMLFVPYHRGPRPVMALFARVAGDPEPMVQAIQRAVWSIDPTRPVSDVRRVDRLVSDSLGARRLAEQVAGVTAGLALLMTLVGIYGTLNDEVSRRQPEIGVRLAVGARGRDIGVLVVRQGGRPIVMGLSVGMLGALFAASLARAQFYDVSAFEPWTYAGAALLLLATAAAACAMPAVRASRLDPVAVLRGE